ncbi:hypothetical protein ACO9S2_07745 [Nitrospira sp. NS4]|uniref:hypothetical protein n=1 Tax=Nitrospira sp. NS4 TaxID=3414498 RepID=UPI003C2D5531
MPDTRSRFGDSPCQRMLVQKRGLRWITASLSVISLLNAGFPGTTRAQDQLPGSPLFGPTNMPLAWFDPIPIRMVLANPGDYHLRQIRMTGTSKSVQTVVLPQGCGRPYEPTILRLEGETGTIEVFDQGACGGNTSRLRASTLAAGDPIDLFVRVVANKEAEGSGRSAQVLVIWIGPARK